MPASSITYQEETGKLVFDLTKLVLPLASPPKVFIPGIVSRSMDPVVDKKGNLIYIAGATAGDHQRIIEHLEVGDIAAYRFPADLTKPATAYIAHRIIEIGTNSQGKYFKFKGDNNSSADPWKVRTDNIKFVSIGVIY